MVAEKNKTLTTDRVKNQMKRTGINLILILGAIVMLTPLLWMLATALSPNTKIPPTSLIPHNITLENFVAAWNFPRAFSPDPNHPITMGTFFMNSIICTVCITIFGIIVDSLAAYVLAFKDFPGKRLFIFLALATMMIPFYVTLVPEYLIIRELGWMNTYKAMIIPFLASGMGIAVADQNGSGRHIGNFQLLHGKTCLRKSLRRGGAHRFGCHLAAAVEIIGRTAHTGTKNPSGFVCQYASGLGAAAVIACKQFHRKDLFSEMGISPSRHPPAVRR